MADPAQAVRDAAKTLSTAIQAANAAGYQVSPTDIGRRLDLIAVSETSAVEAKKAEAAAAIESSPLAKGVDAPAADASKGTKPAG